MFDALEILIDLISCHSWRTFAATAILIAAGILAGVTGLWWLFLVGVALCWLPFLGVSEPTRR